MIGKLIRITAPYFCAGLITYSGRRYFKHKGATIHIREHITAPILRYMSRWTVADIFRYCKRKNWKYEVIKNKAGFTFHELCIGISILVITAVFIYGLIHFMVKFW